VERIRRSLGRLASHLESLVLPDTVPPLHLRWSYYRSARRNAHEPFAASSARELISRGLEPHHRVLDVGCGLGPLALGLLPYLTTGSYEGVDVHAEAIAWCRRAIESRLPRFRFKHADVSSAAYNPRGTLKASDYRLPFSDDTFDFAYLGSVFTHLLPAEAAHYLCELARVLRPGGKCVMSYYLLNDSSRQGIDAGTSFLPFSHGDPLDRCRVVRLDNPAWAVAHAEDHMRDLHDAAGLCIEEPIQHGRWWDGVAHQQDVITAIKPAPMAHSFPVADAIKKAV
jgi:SAM-dependent methyltransferase